MSEKSKNLMSEVDKNLSEQENQRMNESESKEADLFTEVDRSLEELLEARSGLDEGTKAIDKKADETGEALTEEEATER